jgi:hypothetical protein
MQLLKMSQLSWCYLVSLVLLTFKLTEAYYFNSVPYTGDEPQDYQFDSLYMTGNVQNTYNS